MKTSRSWTGMVMTMLLIAALPPGMACAFEGGHFGGGQFGGWYFYPASVYPYPDPYVPATASALSAGCWHYCASVNAYYPYVTECPAGWQPVVPQAAAS